MKRPAPRQIALFATLGLSLAATAWVASNDEPEVAAPAPRRSVAAAVPAAAQDWPGPASATRTAWPEADAEARRAWADTAPPAPTAVAASPTQTPNAQPDADDAAPPFPYELVGRMTDSRPRVVLNGAQRSLVLGAGEVVDGQWRIEAIEPGGLRLKRLPDGPSQFIAFPPS
ncbi:hypothetical protein [Roseateles sp. LYH14W]|uniref:General secretion pathway protein GspB n=1 Tax=Pelomonas parva TaxID=3299032 RepID=A0ABW7EYQ3_9BURK